MNALTMKYLDRYRDFGLLVLRVGIGLMFIGHGWPKMAGGPDKWAAIGKHGALLGLDFVPAELLGFLAAFAEFGGGILLILGLGTRWACALLVVTMAVAAMRHLSAGDGFGGWSHAVEAGILFASLIFIGPGKYSLDEKL